MAIIFPFPKLRHKGSEGSSEVRDKEGSGKNPSIGH
jgi:hypothetical protein